MGGNLPADFAFGHVASAKWRKWSRPNEPQRQALGYNESVAEKRIRPTYTAHHQRGKTPQSLSYILLALVVTLLAETTVFNLSFWKTAFASSNSSTPSCSIAQLAANHHLGSGLKPASQAFLTVTDSSQAYIDLPLAPKTAVSRLYLDSEGIDSPGFNDANSPVRGSYSVSINGNAFNLSPQIRRTAYLTLSSPSPASSMASSLRIWISEPRGSQIALKSIQVNPRVPFSFNGIRVGLLFLLLLLLIALRPRSELYRMPLDPSSRRQRTVFGLLILLPCLALIVGSAMAFGLVQTEGVYHLTPDSYTYNFHQYQLSAQAILKGQPWVDLPVDPLLAKAAHPHSVATRNHLLSQGATIYWDYVFYQGHWYSYFGIIPALLLFLPFQFLTSGMHPGGLWLNSITASFFLLALAMLFGTLALIRFLKRYFPSISLGQTILAIIAMLCGSNIISLLTNLSFYCIPTASATALMALGFWLWLGARRIYDPELGHYRMWTVADAGDGDDAAGAGNTVKIENSVTADQAEFFSSGRIFWGSFCIALTLGCRPPFILSAPLLIPLYLELLSVRRQATGSKSSWIPATLTALIPALIAMAPVLISNKLKFGSLLDFGSKYQMTVEDLTTYKPPLSSVVQGFLTNFWAPFQATPGFAFPFINSYAPTFRPWMYSDNLMAGIFAFAPLCWLILSVLIPGVRRGLRRSRTFLLFWLSLGLAFGLNLLEAYMGGVDWRYMNDFSWLITLASLPVFVLVTSRFLVPVAAGAPRKSADPTSAGNQGGKATGHFFASFGLWILVLVVLFELLVFVLTIFDPSRAHSLLTVSPSVFYAMKSVFLI